MVLFSDRVSFQCTNNDRKIRSVRCWYNGPMAANVAEEILGIEWKGPSTVSTLVGYHLSRLHVR